MGSFPGEGWLPLLEHTVEGKGDGHGWDEDDVVFLGELSAFVDPLRGIRGHALDTFVRFLDTRQLRMVEDLLTLHGALPHSEESERLSKIQQEQRGAGLSPSRQAPPVGVLSIGAKNALAGAASAEGFLTLWRANFPQLSVELAFVEGPVKDDRHIQAVRDIERDTLCINGQVLQGAAGYGSIASFLVEQIWHTVSPVVGYDDGVSSLSKQVESFARVALKAANRTESGGLSFEAIMQVLSLNKCSQGSIVIVPDSSKAEPLIVNVQSGRCCLLPGPSTFGVSAHIKAVTIYSIYSRDMEKIMATLRATFRNALHISVSPMCPLENAQDFGYRSDNGTVQIDIF